MVILGLGMTVEGETHNFHGVVIEEGAKMILSTSSGLISFVKVSPEEVNSILDDCDPIEAPSNPYKLQPENQGKLLWITGPPGLGKSTTAQLLAKEHGYVYYEADCFNCMKNPYIPVDVEDPTMATIRQKDLKGEGLEHRKEMIKNWMGAMKEFEEGQYNKKVFDEYFSLVFEDIQKEKSRIGGQWAVAQCVMLRDMRDTIR